MYILNIEYSILIIKVKQDKNEIMLHIKRMTKINNRACLTRIRTNENSHKPQLRM